ncbi:MAG: NYN domain-containing protein [Bifidobacteriaceae bacterium]|jgi:uncharacterized LabA/DUF88 family protein|nr:NYN domain-containing protein [Bifidobacteriaceae bacterium]
MRAQCSLYVDAGYLLASAATRLTESSLRAGVRAEYEPLIGGLIEQAEGLAGCPLLRVNWYDAAKDALPDRDQERVGALPRVKVRLGRVGQSGEQKGVDLRIGLDMVAQARYGAVDMMLLVSGDDDLTEAVEEAQVHGVQVKVLAVPNLQGHPHGVSRHLLRASDGIELIAAELLDQTITRVVRKAGPGGAPLPGPRPAPRTAAPGPLPGPKPLAPPVRRVPESTLAYQTETGGKAVIAPEYDSLDPKRTEQIDLVVTRVIESFLASATPEERAEVLKTKPSIRPDLDRALLLDLAHRLDDHDLSELIRYELRDHFWAELTKAIA